METANINNKGQQFFGAIMAVVMVSITLMIGLFILSSIQDATFDTESVNITTNTTMMEIESIVSFGNFSSIFFIIIFVMITLGIIVSAFSRSGNDDYVGGDEEEEDEYDDEEEEEQKILKPEITNKTKAKNQSLGNPQRRRNL